MFDYFDITYMEAKQPFGWVVHRLRWSEIDHRWHLKVHFYLAKGHCLHGIRHSVQHCFSKKQNSISRVPNYFCCFEISIRIGDYCASALPLPAQIYRDRSWITVSVSIDYKSYL